MPLSGSGQAGPPLLPPRRPERALAVAALAFVIFHQPFLRIFDQGPGTRLLGMPLLYTYLFIAWAVVIVLTAVVMERRVHPSEATDGEPPTPGETAAAPTRHLDIERH